MPCNPARFPTSFWVYKCCVRSAQSSALPYSWGHSRFPSIKGSGTSFHSVSEITIASAFVAALISRLRAIDPHRQKALHLRADLEGRRNGISCAIAQQETAQLSGGLGESRIINPYSALKPSTPSTGNQAFTIRPRTTARESGTTLSSLRRLTLPSIYLG